MNNPEISTLKPGDLPKMQQSFRKAVAIVSPNLVGDFSQEISAESLKHIIKTYTSLLSVASNSSYSTNVTIVEISESFAEMIQNSYQINYGPLSLATRTFNDPDTSTSYVCLSSIQFREYLKDFHTLLEKETRDAVECLNTLTEETSRLSSLNPFLESDQ